jgi:hypothetical protein
VAAPKVETPVAAVKEEKAEVKEVDKKELSTSSATNKEVKETKKSDEVVKEKKEDKKETYAINMESGWNENGIELQRMEPNRIE